MGEVMNMLEVKYVCKAFGDVQELNVVKLCIRKKGGLLCHNI